MLKMEKKMNNFKLKCIFAYALIYRNNKTGQH